MRFTSAIYISVRTARFFANDALLFESFSSSLHTQNLGLIFLSVGRELPSDKILLSLRGLLCSFIHLYGVSPGSWCVRGLSLGHCHLPGVDGAGDQLV